MQLQGSRKLDLAVAFVGADWWELLANHRGKLRLVCWLSSPNTNPYAIEDLMNNRPQTQVRQRSSMHAKVYVARGQGAIVGSANLSKAALSDADIAGQDEAAVLICDGAFVSGVQVWFNQLWKCPKTKPIRPNDLAAAKEAWNKAMKSRGTRVANGFTGRADVRIPSLPPIIDPEIARYANRVRSRDIEDAIGECCEFVQSLDPQKITARSLGEMVEHIVSWTKHRSAYDRFLSQPIRNVRAGLELLFDDAEDPQTRLDTVIQDGLLAGLRIPTLSLLLYWRNPRRFVPYNFRTVHFLDNFKLAQKGMSASSGRCYVSWLRWATRFAQRLKLPTPGHLDRIVECYYEDSARP